jgi:uncharacterized protein (DUF1778 family)
MSTEKESVRRARRLSLRTTSGERSLLMAASQAMGVTLSEFVLSHATRAAEGVLADRRAFALDETAWREFSAALDRPARDVPGLRDLLGRPSVLDA